MWNSLPDSERLKDIKKNCTSKKKKNVEFVELNLNSDDLRKHKKNCKVNEIV